MSTEKSKLVSHSSVDAMEQGMSDTPRPTETSGVNRTTKLILFMLIVGQVFLTIKVLQLEHRQTSCSHQPEEDFQTIDRQVPDDFPFHGEEDDVRSPAIVGNRHSIPSQLNVGVLETDDVTVIGDIINEPSDIEKVTNVDSSNSSDVNNLQVHRRIRRSLPTELLEEFAGRYDGDKNDDDVGHSTGESETMHRTRGSRHKRHKDKAITAASPKSKAVKKQTKPDVGIHLNLNVEVPAESIQRIQRGGTIILTGGELGPSGYRPVGGGGMHVFKPWRVADWAKNSSNFLFNSQNGHVVVKKTGIYFIYSQILFHNAAARSCYAITVGHQGLPSSHVAKCWSSVDVIDSSNANSGPRFKTCYTSVTIMLQRDQNVWIEDLYGNAIRPEFESNYFGIIKMADL